MEKSNPCSSETVAEVSALLHLLLYAALACAMSTLRRENRAGRVGGWKLITPPDGNVSRKATAWLGAHVPVTCPQAQGRDGMDFLGGHRFGLWKPNQV